MAIHILQIGKHRFVCGLFWQSLSRPRELAKEAADLAKRIDFDLMVLRRDHTTAQAGFAQARDGARKKMFSLAAAVSKSMAMEGAYYDGEKQSAHNWLAAFKLPDGMWAYFAVRDANFLPNGDFAGTKDEVLERLHGDYGLGGWNVVIGDAELEEYGFHNFNAKRLEDVLPRKSNGQLRAHKWWGLQPVARQISWPLAAAAASVLILVAASGAMYWQKVQKQKEEEARDRAIAAARQKMLGNAAPSALPHPWASKPAPQEMVQACLGRFSHITAGGWALDDYVCAGGQASYTWSRQGSNIDFLRAQVPNAVIDIGGDKATYSVALTLPPGKDEALLEQKTALEPLISRLQRLNLSPRIRKEQPPPPPPPQGLVGGANNEMPMPDWQTFPFTLSAGGIPLVEVATILGQPGMRIDKLIYRGGAWSIEGVVYAK
ncbi:pilus assembly protein [Noviherbaspirillum cavernae]|uniref:Pilus assembly protein n=1 Tax=Noviherbaspirillum cavernae TaxID=2320862 RepID=A0A418WWF1_9BURK|nr:type 4b pilus protein PilO2 [Noviherbaspirillum cavernae]RJF96861.1 pilus assembly protein [Noviherbaspirillum cavernae]